MPQSQDIPWLLHDANLGAGAVVIAADAAGVGLGNIKAKQA